MRLLTQSVALTMVIATLSCTYAVAAEPEIDNKAKKPLISLTKLAPDVTPVSDYTGDNIWDRSTLLGDVGGKRQALYEKGITLLTFPNY